MYKRVIATCACVILTKALHQPLVVSAANKLYLLPLCNRP